MAYVQQLARGCLLAILAAGSSSAFAETTQARDYAINDGTTLQLTMPVSWQVRVKKKSEKAIAIELTPATGAPFEILIMAGEKTITGDGSIRDKVAAAAKQLEPQSVEGTAVLQKLNGPSSNGFHFALTDPHPKPGEFKYLDQGITRVGEIDAAFTILTNDGQESTVKAALEMLQQAHAH
jgi:hypothetical protein